VRGGARARRPLALPRALSPLRRWHEAQAPIAFVVQRWCRFDRNAAEPDARSLRARRTRRKPARVQPRLAQTRAGPAGSAVAARGRLRPRRDRSDHGCTPRRAARAAATGACEPGAASRGAGCGAGRAELAGPRGETPMNCEDIALFMDDRDVNGLDQAQSKLVHAHLEKCAQCAAEWDAYARVLAAPLDAMRPELRRDVRQAVVESVAAGRGRGRYLRPMLLGLLVAGAAAAMFALAPDLGENASTVARNGGGVVPTQLQAAQGPSTAVAPFEGSVDGPTRGDGVAAAGGGRERLVMLPTRHETSNQTAIDGINATHAAFVRFLRERTDLEVIELLEQEEAGVPVSISFLRVVRWLITLGRSNEQDRARDVARHYGASYLV